MKRPVFTLIACLTGIMSLAVATAQTNQSLQIGQVKIFYYDLDATSSNGKWQGKIQGKAGNPVKITSKPYDVSGQTIDLTLAGKSLSATRIVATGKVRLVSRNEVTGQKVIATCDKSIYSTTPGATDQGTIELLGNFRAEQYSAGTVGPVVLTGDRGTFRFLANGNLSFSSISEDGSGTITGQPIEPTPKPKIKQP
ncbi:MAG: hypothetical protein H7145_21595 [Akkermansiaceae bacterium]|nr:hypothetical protein [Armatimonadota bacterium]